MNSSRRYRDRRESEEGVNLIEGQATKKLCRERERNLVCRFGDELGKGPGSKGLGKRVWLV